MVYLLIQSFSFRFHSLAKNFTHLRCLNYPRTAPPTPVALDRRGRPRHIRARAAVSGSWKKVRVSPWSGHTANRIRARLSARNCVNSVPRCQDANTLRVYPGPPKEELNRERCRGQPRIPRGFCSLYSLLHRKLQA